MRLRRTLAPTAAPIPLWNLLRALSGVWSGSKHRKRLIQELKAKFSAHEVFLVSSGKAALTVILKALAAGSTRRRVVIPAYTCFSVPSAIVKAGLEVVLCDIEPKTLDYKFAELEALLNEQVLCVLSTHLFGLAADVGRVKRLCEKKGIAVVEDVAQAMGAQSGGCLLGTLGDVAFFSLGRGKNLTCGTGGIILTNSPAISQAIHTEYATLDDCPVRNAVRNWLEVLVMKCFHHPALYWLPVGLPFLRLGETKFYTDFPMLRMDEVRARQLQGWDGRVTGANRTRAACAHWLLAELDLLRRAVQPITRSDAVYLRLPVLVRDRETKETVVRSSQELGAGISGNYPTTIQDIPELAGRIVDRNYPGAQEVVNRLVTLPTHRFVKEQDRLKIERILKHKNTTSLLLNRTARGVDEAADSRLPSVSIKECKPQ